MTPDTDTDTETEIDTSEYLSDADERLAETYKEPMGLEEFLERLFENPGLAAQAPKYLLNAVEHAGTRTVIEEGEEKERYCFFDDPWNDGEHAVLGNTEVLNKFVDDLRSIASGRGKDEKILWVEGPTATGKSEFKRCLVNGLKEYSKTDEGRRYTLEWTLNNGANAQTGAMTYGEGPTSTEGDWYQSPVQVHPLAVFPEDVRESIVADLNEELDDPIALDVASDLDPFSREAYEYLEDEYRREGVDDLFTAVTDEDHCRVANYVVDIGQGVGVLHAEDDGSIKERLVGSWMPSMYDETNSRGRKNPQAFSYDGVVSQGNGQLTVVEDAGEHIEILVKLLNIPDESHVKLDKGIGMDVDTQLLVISNPDLTDQLNAGEEADEADHLKAIKRRLEKHEFRYLTNLSLEAQLLRRELIGETDVWTADSYDELEIRTQEGQLVHVADDTGGVIERELAPHTIEAASMYSVLSRLEGSMELGPVEKARLYDQGYLDVNGERVEADEFDLKTESEGRFGIPVTYTRDLLADLLQHDHDRSHHELDVESVVMPTDIIDTMQDSLDRTPMFSSTESSAFENIRPEVEGYVYEQQSEDVLDAVLVDEKVDDEMIAEYMEYVYAWVTDETVDSARGKVEPDPMKMQVFETEYLGLFDDDDYYSDHSAGNPAVKKFRKEDIVAPLKKATWDRRTEDYELTEVFWDVPVIKETLHDYTWDDVKRIYENFDPTQWDDPPEGTETETVKEKALEHMIDNGYTRASAELTSRRVMSEVSYKWD